MKQLSFILFTATLFLFACNSKENANEDSNSGNPEIEKLKAENQKLQNALNSKDSAINEYFRSFNEIEDNLVLIREKEKVINLSRNNDPELKADQKDRIIEEIQVINSLMEENKNKIAALRSKLKKGDMKIAELEKTIENLVAKINDQELTISALREELARYDIAYAELTATLNETVAVVEEKQAEINTAYYVFGTSKELKNNGIITKEGGFIGIGKIKKLKDDFNKDYFTKIDITKNKEFTIGAKKAELLTTHPSGSYKLVGEKNIEKLVINDPKAFWSVSKYLVMIVE
jgi:DNA repair exonuclease SbcCD ATPase subunit